MLAVSHAGPRVFLCYRREDSPYAVSMLHRALVDRFGRERVFIDVDSIGAGADWDERLDSELTACDVLLAVIGQKWLTCTDRDGRRRLDDAKDEVVREISTVLDRGRAARVIPVLVDGVKMPRSIELPPPLVRLPFRQAVEVRALNFDDDAQRLLDLTTAPIIEVDRSSLPQHADAMPERDLEYVIFKATETCPRRGEMIWEDVALIFKALKSDERLVGVEFLRLRRFEGYAVAITDLFLHLAQNAQEPGWKAMHARIPSAFRPADDRISIPLSSISGPLTVTGPCVLLRVDGHPDVLQIAVAPSPDDIYNQADSVSHINAMLKAALGGKFAEALAASAASGWEDDSSAFPSNDAHKSDQERDVS